MFYFTLALRYLKGRKKFFFTFSNMLSLLGIVIGVFSLLVVSSVMNGFDSDMRSRIIGSKAEIKVYSSDYSAIEGYDALLDEVETVPGVEAVAPVCENELILQKQNKLVSTVCYGIDFDRHKKITDILDKVVVGSPTAQDLEDDGIIIGLDESLTLSATVGEYVQLSSPIGSVPTPFGLLPKSKKLKVVGLFISGMPEYDAVFSYISLKNAQYFLGHDNSVSQLEIKTNQPKHSARMAKQIQAHLGDRFVVEDWSEFEANLFNAIKLEKVVMFLVLALMIIIASFNMTGNFIKLVAEKKVEIGVLKAMGASERDVVNVFVCIGLMIGTIGTLLGLLSSLMLLLAQQQWHFIRIPVPGFPLQWVPVEIRLLDFVLVPIFAVIISFLTTLRPSRRTVKIDPIKIIRNE